MKTNSSSPRLLLMGYYKAPAVSEVTPRMILPRTSVVELVTGGVVYFRSGQTDFKLGCGALFWHVAGEETIYRTEAESPYECLALSFTATPNAPRPVPRMSFIPDQQRTRELSDELLRSYHNDAIDRTALGNYAYSRLIWEVQRGAALHASVSRVPALEIAHSFIEREFRRAEIGVPQIAKAAELSEPHFYTLFREHMGQTPYQFLTTRRIREAKWLLTGTNDPIKTISNDCGFINIETFYRAFRRIVGTTPHHFRRSHSASTLTIR